MLDEEVSKRHLKNPCTFLDITICRSQPVANEISTCTFPGIIRLFNLPPDCITQSSNRYNTSVKLKHPNVYTGFSMVALLVRNVEKFTAFRDESD